MIKRVLLVACMLSTLAAGYANALEFRIEEAVLRPKNCVGAFNNLSGTPSGRPAGTVDQEMEAMQALKISVVQPYENNISFFTSVYTPIKGVMSPRTIYSNAGGGGTTPAPNDSRGVSGKFSMLLGQLGAEYTLYNDGVWQSFVGGGIALAYFYDGGTEALLNHAGHAVEDFDIDHKLTWYLMTGVNINLTENFSLTGSISYMNLKTDGAYQFS